MCPQDAQALRHDPTLRERLTAAFALLCLICIASSARAQQLTFDSGSTGADGPFAPTSDVTRALPPNGVFNFTTINIPTNVTVRFTRNANNTPVVMLASGNVNISGAIVLNGADGALVNIVGSTTGGGAGGPGGFDGGRGGSSFSGFTTGLAGNGPGAGGGGGSSANGSDVGGGGGGGFASTGTDGGQQNNDAGAADRRFRRWRRGR
jgi:hypothetical protein